MYNMYKLFFCALKKKKKTLGLIYIYIYIMGWVQVTPVVTLSNVTQFNIF